MERLNLDRKSLRKFGMTMSMIFLLITLFIFIREKHVRLSILAISAVFFVSALTIPVLLKPVYILWMGLARILAWINTRLILSIIFYVVFTPIGAVIRLFGLDLLDRKINKNNESYWLRKEQKEFNLLDYERQF